MKRLLTLALFSLLVSATTFGQQPRMAFWTDLEKDVFRELNLVRTNPKAYAQIVLDLKKHYEGKMLNLPGQIPLQTTEGWKAAKECYEYLLKAEPVEPLRPSRGLSSASKDHVQDQGRTSNVGHDGTDGSSMVERIERYGNWHVTVGENIDYGNNTGREIVLALLIDDGVPSRGHRTNIMNPEFRAVGIACGPHKGYRYMCVMDLAGDFSKKNTIKTRGQDSATEE
ncbi:MAG: CAP domain-containing protein [Bacteroidetes bacterium]|nr:CAP domain-containing protein [Bacteroidota bacterium]